MTRMVATIYAAAVISGYLSFILAGGIPKLASDVGTGGAWALSLFVQLIYATLFTVGFAIYVALVRKLTICAPTLISVATSAALISSAINVYGVFRAGPGVNAAFGASLVIGGSVALLVVTALICNGLTRQSKSPASGLGRR